MLVQRRVTPGAVGLVIAISGMSSVPSTAFTTPATAAALDAMRARVFRVHRRVGDRLPSCLTISGRVAISVAVANGRDRPPEVVMVLGVQHSDDRVVEPNRNERHEPRAVDDAHLLCDYELAREGVIGWRTDQSQNRAISVCCAVRFALVFPP